MTAQSQNPLPTRISRRAALQVAGAGAAGAGATFIAPGLGAVARAEAGQQLEGSWVVTVTPAGVPAPPFRTLSTYSPDGTVVTSGAPVQPAPPGLGVARLFTSTDHGEWVRTGDRTFAVTFLGLTTDENGRFIATLRGRASVTLEETGMSFSGPFETAFVGPDEAVLASFRGMVQGARIRVEPLE